MRQYRQRPAEKKDWKPEEDERLIEAVKSHGENWQAGVLVSPSSYKRASHRCDLRGLGAVALHVGSGRNSNQCINRWSKTINPAIKRGKWIAEEDEALRQAVAACGPIWKNVCKRMNGRTDAQCRERWTNKLDPNLKFADWTPEVRPACLFFEPKKGVWFEARASHVGGCSPGRAAGPR